MCWKISFNGHLALALHTVMTLFQIVHITHKEIIQAVDTCGPKL